MNTGGKVATGILVPLAVVGAAVGGYFMFFRSSSSKSIFDTRPRGQSLNDEADRIMKGQSVTKAADAAAADIEEEFHTPLSSPSSSRRNSGIYLDGERLSEEEEEIVDNYVPIWGRRKGGKRGRKTRSKRHRKSSTHRRRR